MLLAIVAVAGMAASNGSDTASAASGEVVFLSTADVGFGAGQVKGSFEAAGKTVVYKTAAEWAAMTTADFADYDAVVLPDPTCAGSTAPIAAAIANAATWGAAVDGNVIIIGTDEQFHYSQGGRALSDAAAAFVVADAGKTGAYVSLGCYYHGTAPGTPVPMLDGAFGGSFTVTNVPGCYNSAHIVATHPAMAGLTDATLSNWGCSVHEAFDNWPINFEVLAIALTGTIYNAPDGTIGTPYILARGVEVISDIDLSPADATNELGESHELTAVVTTDDPVPGTPVVGTTVTFEIVGGPHTGVIGSSVTDGTGTATISYTGTVVGMDTIEATFVDALGRTQRSNRVTKTWVQPEICGDGIDNNGDGQVDEGCNEAPDCSTATPSVSSIWPPNHQMVPVAIEGVTDADGDTVTITITGITQDEPVDDSGDGSFAPDGSGVGTDTAEVRAERQGTKGKDGSNGRVYEIGFTADDGNGGSCSGSVQVGVPHDQKPGNDPVDDGQAYDSTVS